jgi:hypothetical protein
MRHAHLLRTAALALIVPALMTNASAQQQKRGGGPAPAAAVQHAAPPAPHISAPAPQVHMAAPQVHMAAPQVHMAAPQVHMAAPAQHFSAPAHVAGPGHVSTPHNVTQQMAHPNIAHSNFNRSGGNHPNAVTSVTRQQQMQVRHNDATAGSHNLAHRGGPSGPNATNSKVATPNNTVPSNASRTATGPNKTVPNTAASKQATPNNKTTPNSPTPSVLGQGPGNQGRNGSNQQAQARAQQQAQARTQIYDGNRRPTLHNQAFANIQQRDPATRALARANFQGGFARFHDRDHDHDRFAQRRGFHGVVLGWVGPLFWPYAYTDFVDYAYWPYASDSFWPYAYDDVYDGIFGAYAPDSTAYASVSSSRRRLATRSPTAAGLPPAGSAQICSGQATGLTDWPIERIAQQVGPDDNQRMLLDNLKDATEKAVNLLQSACPTDLPSTPTGRLSEMHQRIQSMLQAVQLVRPALEKFYQSLSDEQKERFISLEAEPTAARTRTARQQPNLAQACGSSSKQITGLPTNQIQQLLHPNEVQQAALQELNDATAKAASILSQNCPQDEALTPPGRVAAMEQRLSAMLQALETVQPAMAKFYNSLSDEQKARFDRMPPRQA